MTDPLGAGLRQPDPRSCGAASLEMARLVRAGAPAPDQSTFGAAVLARHRALTGLRSHGRWQLPWPRVIGTPPWAVARDLKALTGRRHRVRLARRRRRASYDGLVAGGGVLYVGSRWLPRHVVLVLDPGGGAPRCYEPSSGRVVELEREAFTGCTLALAGWTHPWFTITPAG